MRKLFLLFLFLFPLIALAQSGPGPYVPNIPKKSTDLQDMPKSLIGHTNDCLKANAALGIYTLGACSSSGGASKFTDLSDVPNSYIGQGTNIPRVNSGATGLEFRTPSQVKSDIGLSNVPNLKVNLNASANPTVNDDTNAGYSIGSLWIRTNTTPRTYWVATDVSAGAAVWKQLIYSDQVLDTNGIIISSILPNPSASTLGGVQSIASQSHKFLTAISTSGVPSSAQPALADLSDASSVCTLTGTQTLTNKTLNANSTTLIDNTDNTKILQFGLSGLTTGHTVTLTPQDITTTYTIMDKETYDALVATLGQPNGIGMLDGNGFLLVEEMNPNLPFNDYGGTGSCQGVGTFQIDRTTGEGYSCLGTGTNPVSISDFGDAFVSVTDAHGHSVNASGADTIQMADSGGMSIVCDNATHICTYSLNISGLTEDTTPSETQDFLLLYDNSTSTHKKLKPTNLTVGKADALSANGSNCASGNYPLGVDASGNAESCTAAPKAVEVFFWLCQETNSSTSTKYLNAAGSVSCVTTDATNSPTRYIVTRTGNIKNLFCSIAQGASATNNITFTVRKNGADTTVTYNQTTSGVGAGDTTHSPAVNQGDELSLSYLSATSATNYGYIRCSVEVNFTN